MGVRTDMDSNANASSTNAGAQPTFAIGRCGNTSANGNGTVVPIASPGVIGQ
jgi:hypothetical protein